uniref:Uncharacterized protein n=1 Tax=Oryza brachyantha TaxID=4533 RepID=J3LZC8_ORYBR
MASGDGAAARVEAGEARARQCICSPTTHAGSFRCRLHRRGGTLRGSVSCVQFSAGAESPQLLCPSLMRRSRSQQQLRHHPPASWMSSRSASDQQLLRYAGVERSASCQDFTQKEYYSGVPRSPSCHDFTR